MILFALIGLLSGIAGGYFGIGGAIIIIPLLMWVAKFSQLTAQGTTLAALVLPIGALAAWKYWQNGHVQTSAALLIAAGFFIGGGAGAWLAQHSNPDTLRKAFGVLLIGVGIKTLLK